MHAIVASATEVAEGFVRDALNVDLVGLRTEDMVEYVKCTADYWVKAFGYAPIYNAVNPFSWMAVIGMTNKTNFFEQRVSEYARQANMSLDNFTFTTEF